MKIKVTAKDIRLGKKKSEIHCPVARALRRHSGFKACAVDSLSVATSTGRHVTRLPVVAVKFIYRFDDGKPVKPFTFELKLK